MEVLAIILKIVFFIICIGLIAIVLLQQGKVSGLSGAIGGAGETYWGKNKARSMEGGLHKITIGLAIAYIVISIVLNML
jgi:preprotein translocase subunit SecG